MDKGPEFDRVKAAFYLVAFVISVQCFVVLIGVIACVWHAPEIIAGKAQCNAKEQLIELLAQAMTAAMAFAGGYSRKD